MIHVNTFAHDTNLGAEKSADTVVSVAGRKLRLEVTQDGDATAEGTSIKIWHHSDGIKDDPFTVYEGTFAELVTERYSIHELTAEIDHLKGLADSRGVTL